VQKDTIVEQVRMIRHEIEQECQQDPDRLFQYFRGSQEKLRNRLVCRGPKLLEPLPRKDSTG